MNVKRYGIDAPFALLIYTVFGIGLLGHAFLNRSNYPIGIEVVIGIVLIVGAAIYWHTTTSGKYRIFDHAVEQLRPDIHDQILDLGCGRGALLTRLASQVQVPGKVVGLDLWLSRDQSNNKMTTTQKNVDDLGLTERVNLVTGDMTKLDFPDESFEIITSSFAIHNIKNKQARDQAINEAVRVLKPHGKIMIIDTGHNMNEYGQTLQAAGVQVTQLKRLGFNGWWATPLTGSYMVVGCKTILDE
ncbi:methyltransferase domain-containing protein [Lactiplantibacillus sp. WILCCON 0030]|uniref:Methyltransferase domain-containing protein n=1 Tax=Lactiplantibacillus brownii TaxID=3069269 RepID=A0ABU1ACN3_9LACO|nr:methyltransferase domain-containing protein [Lactiplantibacillus brownii]MDQ7938400.1 methyltransferase domain-containing protein [Lactiplantibacillus brownii]